MDRLESYFERRPYINCLGIYEINFEHGDSSSSQHWSINKKCAVCCFSNIVCIASNACVELIFEQRSALYLAYVANFSECYCVNKVWYWCLLVTLASTHINVAICNVEGVDSWDLWKEICTCCRAAKSRG